MSDADASSSPGATHQGSSDLPIIVVVGPTASGKSLLAAQLARALEGEVLSADSVQVYRHFDIGSGKPTSEELELAPHHLIDECDPLKPLEASQWAQRAHELAGQMAQRSKVPIVCGGTFLWVRALLYGLAKAPPGNQELRDRHRAYARQHGREALHGRLKEVDPPSASRLHPNDLVRVSRALEVHELSGRKLSDLQQEHGFRSPRFRHRMLRIDWPQDEYEARLRTRVASMLSLGFRQEVRELIERGYGDARAMQSVGYRQVFEAESAGGSISDEQLLEEIVRVTRVFARRQRTWLRDEDILSVTPQALAGGQAFAEIIQILGAHISPPAAR